MVCVVFNFWFRVSRCIYNFLCFLNLAAYLQIDYPMLFEVSNPTSGKITHCGVLEFIADEGMIYLPYWVICFPSTSPNVCWFRIFITFGFMIVDDGEYASTGGRYC